MDWVNIWAWALITASFWAASVCWYHMIIIFAPISPVHSSCGHNIWLTVDHWQSFGFFFFFHFLHYPFFISTGDSGLTLSPEKWSSQISAGRQACKSTQSGKRLICITDKIINEFLPQFYWNWETVSILLHMHWNRTVFQISVHKQLVVRFGKQSPHTWYISNFQSNKNSIWQVVILNQLFDLPLNSSAEPTSLDSFFMTLNHNIKTGSRLWNTVVLTRHLSIGLFGIDVEV